MSYTVFDETFTGTAGSAITGAAGAPVASASDAWGTFSPYPALVYKAGGGAVATTFSGSLALSTYPLTGVVQDQQITVSFTNTTSGSGAANPIVQFHRTADGNNDIAISFDFIGQVVNLQTVVGGTAGPVTSDSSYGALLANTLYTLHVSVVGGTLAVVTLNGTALTTIQGMTVPTGTGTILLIGQVGGSAGNVTFSEVKVQVAGPTTATITGPSTLTVGTASANYTATLGSAVPAGGQGIALVPTASGFSATSTPSTLTIASGATAGTFTETSSTAGSGTISATSAGITVTGQSVTSSSPPATAFTLTAPSPAYGYAGTASGSFTVFPNGATSGTFTPTVVSGVTFTPSALTWSGDASARTFAITGATVGTVSIGGTFSNGLTPPAPVMYAFRAATLSVSPLSLEPSTTTVVEFTGGGTKWTLARPTFALSGLAGVSVGPVTVASDTSASATVTTSALTGTVAYTDSTSSATASQSISAGGQLSVYYPVPSLSTIYFTITRSSNESWNGVTFEPTVAADWSRYAIAAFDSGATGFYIGNFPASIAVGTYSIYGYHQVGASPASTDTLIGTQLDVRWTGLALTIGSANPGTGLTPSGTTLSQAINSTLWGATDRLIDVNPFPTNVTTWLSLPSMGLAQQFWDGFEQLATSYFGGSPIDAGDALAQMTDYATTLNAQAQVASEFVALLAANPGQLRTVVNSTGTAVLTLRTFS